MHDTAFIKTMRDGSAMNMVKSINCIDMTRPESAGVPRFKTSLPGTYAIQMTLDPGVDLKWTERMFGSLNANSLIPGWMTATKDRETERRTYVFRDYTSPTLAADLEKDSEFGPSFQPDADKETTNPEVKKYITEQTKLVRDTGARNVPQAVTALMLGCIVKKGQMSEKTASKFLQDTFILGDKEADLLISRSIDNINNNLSKRR
jgi:hypothetical protein